MLVSSTSDGTLSFNSDGSFTYVPDNGFTGTDSFTYDDVDGRQDLERRHGDDLRGSGDARTSPTRSMTAASAPSPGRSTSPTVDRQRAGRHRLRHPRHRPVRDPADDAVCRRSPTGDHRRLQRSPAPSPNTLAQGDNAVILIDLNGSSVSNSDGLDIEAAAAWSRAWRSISFPMTPFTSNRLAATSLPATSWAPTRPAKTPRATTWASTSTMSEPTRSAARRRLRSTSFRVTTTKGSRSTARMRRAT